MEQNLEVLDSERFCFLALNPHFIPPSSYMNQKYFPCFNTVIYVAYQLYSIYIVSVL